MAVACVACTSPRWPGEAVVEVVGGPPWADQAAAGAVETWAAAGAPVRMAAPGERGGVRVVWGRLGREHDGAIGYTDVRWQIDGEITEATIHLRADLVWSDGEPCVAGFDLESSIAHELGHALGVIGHVDEVGAVMASPVAVCPELRRELRAGDLQAIGELY